MTKYRLIYKDKIHIWDDNKLLLDDITISGKEISLLNRFIEAKGSSVKKDDLMKAVWGDDYDIEEHDIRPHITSLRKKFGQDSNIIKNERYKFGNQSGYKFNCKIVIIDEFAHNIFPPVKKNLISSKDAEMEYQIRKKDITDFLDEFQFDESTKNVYAIKGAGGLGKTTFAHIICNQLQNKYNSVGWIDYSKSLDESLISLTDKKEGEAREDQLERISDYFNNAEKKLLIIDNVVDDPQYNQYPLEETGKEEGGDKYFTFKKLKEEYKNLDVIVTTRSTSFPGYNNYNLSELDEVSGFYLFVYYYDSSDKIEKYNYNDYFIIRDIVKRAHYNALLIERLATAAKMNFFGKIEELYEFIQKEAFNDVSVVEKIYQLYTIENFSQEKLKILWEFAILPNMSLNSRDLNDFLRIKPDNSDFRYLVDRGWISTKLGEGYFMHDIIKESIMCRTFSIESLGIKPDDYDLYSFSYDRCLNGFAPNYCYSSIHQTMIGLSFIFDDDIIDISYYKKRIDLLISITNHVKLDNRAMGYFLSMIGMFTYHKLGDKENGELRLKEALDCLIKLYDPSDKDSIFSYRNFIYDIEEMHIRISYELAYALSSMGYDRINESYNLINTTISTQIKKHYDSYLEKYLSAFDNWTQAIHQLSRTSFPEQYIIKEINTVCKKELDITLNSVDLSDYDMFARILDHAAYIITIYKPTEYEKAKRYFTVALFIRNIIHDINSINKSDTDKLNRVIKPFEDFFDAILMLYPNKSFDNETVELAYQLSDLRYRAEYKYQFISNNNTKLSWIIRKHFDVDENGNLINYRDCLKHENRDIPGETKTNSNNNPSNVLCFLTRDDFMWWLFDIFHITQKQKIHKTDLIASYFKFYTGRKYVDGFHKPNIYIDTLQDLATTEDNLGYLYMQMGQYKNAKIHLKKALKMRIELEELEPQKHLSELSWTYNNVGELYLRLYEEKRNKSDLSKAITNYSDAVSHRWELNALYHDRYLDNLAWSSMGLWRCHLYESNLVDAENSKTVALNIYNSMNSNGKYDNEIRLLQSEDPLSQPINWCGNQSYLEPKPVSTDKKKNK